MASILPHRAVSTNWPNASQSHWVYPERSREEEELLRADGDLPPDRKAYRDSLTRQLYRFPSTLRIPRSLALIGTVNVDDTTQVFSPKFLDRAFVMRFKPAQLPTRLDEMGTQSTGDARTQEPNSELWPLSLDQATRLHNTVNLPEAFALTWADFLSWQKEFLTPMGIHFGYRFASGFRRYMVLGYNLGLKDARMLADDYFQAKIAPRIRFGLDERALGTGGKTKYQYLDEWLKHKTLKDYKRFADLLRMMCDRAQGTEMVELWD